MSGYLIEQQIPEVTQIEVGALVTYTKLAIVNPKGDPEKMRFPIVDLITLRLTLSND